MAHTNGANNDRRALFGSIALLARQEKTWSPALLSGVLWRAAANPGTIWEVRRLFRLPPFAEVTQTNPRFAFKYLTHDYLARSFNVTERASCFLHHYRRLHSLLPDSLLRDILRTDVTLHEITSGGHLFAVTTGLTKPLYCDKEGEFSINLHVDGDLVFMLSFTIVPGNVVNSDSPEVLLISRLQGIVGTYDKIRHATKTLHEVAPGALLLAALQGIAMAFEVGEVASVSATNQSSYCPAYDTVFRSAYDDFFTELGISRNAGGFFSSSVPIVEKPLSFIKQGHKLRTREKRAFRAEITSACAGFFAKALSRPCAHIKDITGDRDARIKGYVCPPSHHG